MKQFLKEQDTNSKPPEPRGEKTPEEEDREDSIEWDGSEAELVADESAEVFDEQHTGIKLKYVLTSREIFRALRKVQYTGTRIALSVVAVLLCAGTAGMFLVRWSAAKDPRYISLAAVCILLILVVGVYPSLRMKIHSVRIADGKEIRMKIYPDHIEMGLFDKKWEILLDGSSESLHFDNMIVLYIRDGNMVILPLRCVEPAVLPEVQAMILAGTQPKA